MLINNETFQNMMKKRGLTQVALAERAGVGVKTVGRIKRGQNLRLSRVKKIADALKTTVEVLISPPSEDASSEERGDIKRLVADLNWEHLNNLTLASFHYKVSINTLIMYAPLLFSLVAELSLKQRQNKLDDWYDSTIKAIKNGPEYDPAKTEYSLLESDLAEIYNEEMESIEKRELAGRSNETDYSTQDWDDPKVPEFHSFLQCLELLAEEAGQELMFYGSTTDDILFHSDAFIDAQEEMYGGSYENLADEAKHNHVLLRDMPKELLAENLVEERTTWLASHYGGANGDIELAREIWRRNHSDENDTKDAITEENKNE